MAGTTPNRRRFDPYKNVKFRVKFDGTYVAGMIRITPKASRDDVSLTGAARTTFGRIITQPKRSTALFVGPKGTGKTVAAEVIASELGTELYRTDLSKVVSQYIGETEKHLARIFAAAEKAGAVLFFDEADALFGKPSLVRKSPDRYANMAIDYLLMRLESYNGVVILATNLKNNIDKAFQRRFNNIIKFPERKGRSSR